MSSPAVGGFRRDARGLRRAFVNGLHDGRAIGGRRAVLLGGAQQADVLHRVDGHERRHLLLDDAAAPLRGVAEQQRAILAERHKPGVEVVEVRALGGEADDVACREELFVREQGRLGNADDQHLALAERAMPRHRLLVGDGVLDRHRPADPVVDVAPAPVGEIMVALVPLHVAVLVADAPQRALELGEIAGDRGGEHHLAERDAIERVVADDEALRMLRAADQRVRPVANAEQLCGDEVDPRRDLRQRPGFPDQPADQRSLVRTGCGGRGSRRMEQRRAGHEPEKSPSIGSLPHAGQAKA